MEDLTLNVFGMSCGHCESSIKQALSKLDGVKKVIVDLDKKTVNVQFDNTKIEHIKNAIEEQGFDIT